MTTSPVVKTLGLGRKFNRRSVLSNISIELPSNAFHVVLGPNGAGKSTLIRIMMRQLQPSSGDCIVLGTSVLKDTAFFSREISYISEDVTINLPHSLEDLGRLNQSLYPRWNSALFSQHCADFGLDQKKRFDEISRGQKIRFQLSAALARGPKVLLLDEITAALDALGRSQVYALLASFVQAGGTVIMATNIPADIQVVDGHIVYIDSGVVRLNEPLSGISKKLAKIRLPEGQRHDLFQDPRCTAVTVNSDKSTSYLMPSELVPEDFPFKDRRTMTVEELVVYLLRHKDGGGL